MQYPRSRCDKLLCQQYAQTLNTHLRYEEQRSSVPVEAGWGVQLDGFREIAQSLADPSQRRQDLERHQMPRQLFTSTQSHVGLYNGTVNAVLLKWTHVCFLFPLWSLQTKCPFIFCQEECLMWSLQRSHLGPLLIHLWAVGFQCNYSAQLIECQLCILDVLQTEVRGWREEGETSVRTKDAYENKFSA